MRKNNFHQLPREQALLTLRIIWAALLLSPMTFLFVIVSGVLHNSPPAQPQRLFFWVDLAMFLTVVPLTFVIRAMTFKRNEVDGCVSAAAYSTGNLIFWAGCEGVSFAGLVFSFLNGSLWPTVTIVAAAMALQVLTFPLGDRMKK